MSQQQELGSAPTILMGAQGPHSACHLLAHGGYLNPTPVPKGAGLSVPISPFMALPLILSGKGPCDRSPGQFTTVDCSHRGTRPDVPHLWRSVLIHRAAQDKTGILVWE